MTRKWGEHPTDGMGLLRVSKMLKDEQSAPLSSKTVTILAALEAAQRAMDDWTRTYAPEFCDSDSVDDSRRRIERYGTIGYIAHVARQLRNAIDLMQQDETTGEPAEPMLLAEAIELLKGAGSPASSDWMERYRRLIGLYDHIKSLPEEPKAEQPEPCRGCGWTIGHALDCPYRFENAMTILRAPEKASRTRLVEQRNGFKDGSTVPEQPEAPTSDKCEHGIPRQFCTAMHAEKTEASLPPCECLLIAKEPSAYHALKCPRFVADKL